MPAGSPNPEPEEHVVGRGTNIHAFVNFEAYFLYIFRHSFLHRGLTAPFSDFELRWVTLGLFFLIFN